ncbi:transcriptional regulator [Enterococcus avium]|uniref:MerR family DNA-binding transcriptional regulator n=1 Tax=Enterococcus malodoratus TaxID=71451 RepID=UPI0008CBDEDA|nr:MerR family transcriptional regulator [Enterococcus malodoratus]BBM17815.1 transcriptional regulator [Enterococcus avium]SET40316.1 DNA-binding transcriptional regulator, MerR family [Enterococcus malodoratus]
MDTTELITIGKLSKLTGIHVKALRYYDRIGILIPAYINPENSYRYYTREHIYLVDMIKLCAEINIPLKDIKEFLGIDGTSIDIDSVLDTGIKLVRNKVDEFEKKLTFLEEMKKEVRRNETLHKQKDGLSLTIESTDYWLEPFNGKIGSNDYYLAFNQLLKQITQKGLEAVYEGGLAMVIKNPRPETFLFITLEPNPQNAQHKNILRLPKTRYLTKVTAEADIQKVYQASAKQLENQSEVILFELEMYASQTSKADPLFEVRIPIEKQ